MRPKELRIGNITEQGTVKTFYEHGIHVGFGKTHKFDEVEPIPLTENWLENFGFKRIGGWVSDEDTEVDKYAKDTLEVMISSREDTHIIIENFELDDISVNRLQNLYFALTGKELTIK